MGLLRQYAGQWPRRDVDTEVNAGEINPPLRQKPEIRQ
jgi:hypothetical protein